MKALEGAFNQEKALIAFMDGTAANNDPFALRSVFHQHQQIQPIYHPTSLIFKYYD